MQSHEIVIDALKFLNDHYDNLPRNKGEKEFLDHLEWYIRLYRKRPQNAIKQALGIWLNGDNGEKVLCAVRLIGRLSVTDHLPDLERLLHELRSGRSRWPQLWIPHVEKAISTLQRQASS